jgi:hypothetical protein
VSISTTGINVGNTFTVNTSQLYFNTNVVISGNSGIYANGSLGTSGQVLTSNATSVYWSTISAGGGAGGFSNGQSIAVSNLAITGSLTANGSTGTYGQILASNGANVYWASVPNFNYNFAYSAQFNGSSSYLTAPANTALQMGTGDFTVEFWINTTDTNAGIYGTASSTSQFNIAFNGTSLVYQSSWGVTNLYFVPLSNLCNGSWHHVAIVRASGVQKVFYDGVVQSLSSGTFTDATNYSGAGNWNIGYDGPSGGNQGYFAGYISNFRVVKGVAVYTGAFTVPSSPLQTSQAAGTNIAAVSSSQVSLLTCNALTLTDSSPNAFIITNTGGVVASTTTVPTFTGLNNATARTQTQTVLTTGSGTYYPPFGVAWLKIRMVGGGGGGGGSGTTGGTPGTVASAGTNTTFGSSFLTASAGSGALNYVTNTNGSVGGAGGSATINSGATGIAITGGAGNGGGQTGAGHAVSTGQGGSSPFGGAGYGAAAAQFAGGAASTNSGSGGGGGSTGQYSMGGGGGGAGGYVEAYISSPAASYAYAVGAGGGGGAAGTSGTAGGGGGSGIIIIEENYPVTGQIPTNASGTTQQFTANGTGNSFTLSTSINTSDAIIAYNGLILPPTVDYTILGRTLNLNFIPANTDLIEVRTMSSTFASGLVGVGTNGGPVFSAWANAGTTCLNGAWTKVAFQVEEFDTTSAYDNTTNYRFTPQTAGYYQINSAIAWPAAASSGESLAVYKNGSLYKIGNYNANNGMGNRVTVSCIVYLNGSTDYVEIYAINNTGSTLSTSVANALIDTYFQASYMNSGVSNSITVNKPIVFSDGTSFGTAQSLGPRNKFINGAMAVDQRNSGSSQTITAAAALAYTVDRWYAYCTGANVTGQRVAGSIASSQYNYQFTGAASVTGIGFGQRIETLNCYDLAGTTATLSVVLSNSLLTTVTWTAYYATTTDTFGTLSIPTRTQIATGTFTVTSTLTKYSTNIAIPSAATTGIEIVFSVGAQTSGTWVIGTAQLEAGSVVTPFERRQYQQEIALCQRYFINLNGGTNNYQSLMLGTLYNTTTGSWIMYLPVQMRAIPTLSYSGTIYAQNINITVSSFGGPYSHIGSIVEGDFTLASGSGSGTTCFIRWNNMAAGSRSFTFNAEI